MPAAPISEVTVSHDVEAALDSSHRTACELHRLSVDDAAGDELSRLLTLLRAGTVPGVVDRDRWEAAGCLGLCAMRRTVLEMSAVADPDVTVVMVRAAAADMSAHAGAGCGLERCEELTSAAQRELDGGRYPQALYQMAELVACAVTQLVASDR